MAGFTGYLLDPSTLAILATVAGLGIFVWYTAVVIYRINFHPLAHIPGPFLARATHLYSFYFNGILDGKLYLQIDKLHEAYGMSRCFVHSWYTYKYESRSRAYWSII